MSLDSLCSKSRRIFTSYLSFALARNSASASTCSPVGCFRGCLRRWRVGDRVRVRWQFTGGWLTGEVIKRDEVSVTMLWDNHTWGQFYYDSPFVWESMIKLPKLQ